MCKYLSTIKTDDEGYFHCSSKSLVYIESVVSALGLVSLPHMNYTAKSFTLAEDLAQLV